MKGGSSRGRAARSAYLDDRILRHVRASGPCRPIDVSIALYGEGVSQEHKVAVNNVLNRLAKAGQLMKWGENKTVTYEVSRS